MVSCRCTHFYPTYPSLRRGCLVPPPSPRPPVYLFSRADLQSRDPETFKPLHVVNMTIKDSPEESAAAAGDVLDLCRMVNIGAIFRQVLTVHQLLLLLCFCVLTWNNERTKKERTKLSLTYLCDTLLLSYLTPPLPRPTSTVVPPARGESNERLTPNRLLLWDTHSEVRTALPPNAPIHYQYLAVTVCGCARRAGHRAHPPPTAVRVVSRILSGRNSTWMWWLFWPRTRYTQKSSRSYVYRLLSLLLCCTRYHSKYCYISGSIPGPFMTPSVAFVDVGRTGPQISVLVSSISRTPPAKKSSSYPRLFAKFIPVMGFSWSCITNAKERWPHGWVHCYNVRAEVYRS